MQPTDRSQLRRLPVRGSHDAETIRQILDAGFLAHVGFTVDGQPFVIPTFFMEAVETAFTCTAPRRAECCAHWGLALRPASP